MDIHPILWVVFATIMVGFLVVDLGWLSRKAHAVSNKEAILQSLFWVTISLIFAGLIWTTVGHVEAAEFLSAYVTEKMLSVDNLFVIMLVFSYFKIDAKYQHRVLFWGILGAVLFRGLFIGLGSVVISHFHWILYFFGAFLVYTGFKLLKGDDDDEPDFANNKVAKIAQKYLPFTTEPHSGRFRIGSTFTILFLTLLVIEATDIIFAVDSIPAVFSITQDPFLVFTSNMFAVMGLRALFFLVENILKTFCHLQKGVSAVLIFIGVKMLLDIVNIHVDPILSLFIIVGILGAALAASIYLPSKD